MSALNNVSALLLTPVHVAIYILFIAALFETGRMIVQWGLRFKERHALARFDGALSSTASVAFPIAAKGVSSKSITIDELDLEAMRRLEFIRIATRITPMLGLIATLIPMGPALVALTKNDVTQMSELLRSAFSAVVLALAASCLCFWIASVRRRWCVEEVLAFKGYGERREKQAPAQIIERRAA